MDKGTSDEPEGKETEKYLWVAAFIIGILLIFMLIAIAGIIIWRHFKKENTAEKNWAGPSPLADGNIHEDMNINEYILGRQRSLSCISTAPIVANEVQAAEKGHSCENLSQRHSGEASMQEDSKTDMSTLPYISSETTSFSSNASEGQQPMQQTQGYYLNDDTSLPPPPDDFTQFPMPLPIEEVPVLGEGRNLQPLSLTDVPQTTQQCNQISLYQENTTSMADSNNNDGQFLPPPPADL